MAARMEGKKAVVVGAGQPRHHLLGNGRAIAMTLAREGAEVCVVDRYEDRAAETAALIRADGGIAHVLTADVSVPADCARIVEESQAALGRIDALVNNVGVSYCDAGPLDLDPAGWQEIMDINLRGMWLTCKAVVPLMKEQGGGAITNISTVGSRTGGGTLFAYAISKSGVNAMTHFFAVEYASLGIRCNAVLPAWIATPHSMEGLVHAGVVATEEQVTEHATRRVPLGRMGTASDVANAVLFLSSDESSFITGLEVPVDGGMLAIIGRYERPEA
ncbi:NAD(P)-dependent dehydrogenase (short-subunit alcohol dehydrogenase family) [Mycolicibacterium sp. BK556]|uniref:SDR family NAD(P)-dependent oxidoreductase n=1 Tax=unclassified Mycolicibacterium TaxID=2636767 RepID=UPI0010499CAD|nr:NAD(P)-dependent dehydrogenase (short-subunit alcohol dehydrogenase family) [Mycolicibacterium sp. BK556]MBB3636209.1 NAD(P)-dependent dehydrogenase (short-subunit alcohol dehydrogenase family) [Mycolicibacterium sp. BK607]